MFPNIFGFKHKKKIKFPHPPLLKGEGRGNYYFPPIKILLILSSISCEINSSTPSSVQAKVRSELILSGFLDPILKGWNCT
jgi:hypothetical protein